MQNQDVVKRTLILMEIYKSVAGSINAGCLQTILLLAIDMAKVRSVFVWSPCAAFAIAMVGLLIAVTRLMYWDSLDNRIIVPRNKVPALVVLALEIGLALIGVSIVVHSGRNDIWTMGCDTKDDRPLANWIMICGMRVILSFNVLLRMLIRHKKASIFIFCTLAVASSANGFLVFANSSTE
jgi:hypothetical protein